MIQQNTTKTDSFSPFDGDVISLKLKDPSMPVTKIAEKLNCHRDRVTRSLKKESVQKYIDDSVQAGLDEIRMTIHSLQLKALKKLDGLLDSFNRKITLECVKHITKDLFSKTNLNWQAISNATDAHDENMPETS